MSEIVIGLVIAVIGLIIAILSIIFVLWDHIHDDLRLRRQIQEFYESFEKLIYSCYLINNTKREYEEKTSGWDENMKLNNPMRKKYKDLFFKHITENHFLNDRLSHNFNSLSTYLGLSWYRSQNFYLNHEGGLLSKEGAIYEFSINLEHNYDLNRRQLFFDHGTKLYYVNDDLIQKINKYLKSMRNYWKKNYKNIFRSKLKPKIDFSNLK